MSYALQEVAPPQNITSAGRRRSGALALLLVVVIGATATITARATSTPSRVPALYSVWRSSMVEVAQMGTINRLTASRRDLQSFTVSMYGANARAGGIAVGLNDAASSTGTVALASSYLGRINEELGLALQLMANGDGSATRGNVDLLLRLARSVVSALPPAISSDAQLGSTASRIMALERSVSRQLIRRGL